MRVVLISVLLSSAAFGQQLRRSITLPKDCSFSAESHEGKRRVLHRCAEFLVQLDAALKQSPWSERCGDLPDLKAASLGESVPVFFHALAPGRFVARVRCSSGAYNEQFLHFVWDERKPASGAAPLQLLYFPFVDGTVDPLVFTRDFDPAKKELLSFRKVTGDGSAGLYRRFSFDDGVPVLRESIEKPESDHLDGWDFDRKSTPKGAGWVRSLKVVRGCIGGLNEPCTP
ncbi:MAG: hypothetical protein GQE15_33695 [Archangiaceae bacterium]|nr:hypothetical protein [Archangiaceae bacterium]